MRAPFEATNGAPAKKRTPGSVHTIGESLTLHKHAALAALP